ncbi:Kiwa anti-phage protein KwaB-like domain-containing protein [Thalassospira sp. CH_XMU1448-2]|uniref:Kiwa anti-phage protein KwaB-like domain-containing protein n=1 Tax=Thalassospira sp. CH_XMU1448-2 TaxID=3107773 RepID=UPI003008A358
MPDLQVGKTHFRDLQNLIEEIAGDVVPLVCTHSRIKGDLHDGWRRAVLEDELSEKFRDEAIEVLRGDDVLDQIEEYTFDNMVEGQIGFWSAEDSDEVAAFIDGIVNSEDAGVLDPRDHAYSENLDMFTINVNLAGETVYFVTRSLSSTIVRKKGLSVAWNADNRLEEFQGDVFHFIIQPCVIVWRNSVYIFNRSKFEMMTGLRAATIQKSVDAFNYITDELNIVIPANEDLLGVIKGKPLLYRRLASASAKGVLVRLSSARMVERIEALSLPIAYAQNDDDFQFNVDHEDTNQVKEFVYLMTDYYLHSPVTDLEHRAPSTHVNVR